MIIIIFIIILTFTFRQNVILISQTDVFAKVIDPLFHIQASYL